MLFDKNELTLALAEYLRSAAAMDYHLRDQKVDELDFEMGKLQGDLEQLRFLAQIKL